MSERLTPDLWGAYHAACRVEDAKARDAVFWITRRAVYSEQALAAALESRAARLEAKALARAASTP